MWRLITKGEQALFNLKIKKKRDSSINPDIHHSKVSSSYQKCGRNPSIFDSNFSIASCSNAQVSFAEKPQMKMKRLKQQKN